MSFFKRKDKSIAPQNILLGNMIKNKDVVTTKSVVLPAENRFQNTLILGSAGCGKTRNTLIPMVKQDILDTSIGVTVLEPNGDFSKEIFEIATHYNRNNDGKRTIQYFNPTLDNCPYFNPLDGNEDDVIETIRNAFLLLNKGWSQFLKNTATIAIRNAVMVAKRLYGNNATIMDVYNILENKDNIGLNQYINVFQNTTKNIDGSLMPPDMRKENVDIVNWFIHDYYSGMISDNKSSKTYENLSELRFQLLKFTQNQYLSKVLNPPRKGDPNYAEYLEEKQNYKNTCFVHTINFNDALKEGHITLLTTANNQLRDLGKLLGYMMSFHLHTAIISRDGNPDTRKPNMLYIDDFPQFANEEFIEVLRLSNSSKVATHLSALSTEQIKFSIDDYGDDFKKCILNNSQNYIVYTGASMFDAEYFSKLCNNSALFDEFKDYCKNVLYYISYSHKKTAYVAVKTKVLEQK